MSAQPPNGTVRPSVPFKADDDRPRMTTKEAAAYLGCKASSLRTGRSRSWGPAFYRGVAKEVLYKKSDLDAWIESRRVEPKGPIECGAASG
jgi:hypothetical protein